MQELFCFLNSLNNIVRKKTENSIIFESYQKGLEEGTKERNIEIAKSMLQENLLVEIITKCTGLKPEEIEKLLEDK